MLYRIFFFSFFAIVFFNCTNTIVKNSPSIELLNTFYRYSYICTNGFSNLGKTSSQNVESCRVCNLGYTLNSVNKNTFICVLDSDPLNSDIDGDGVLASNDIDADNDGLIEIRNISMLYNMRYNLEGSSYVDRSGVSLGNGNTMGASKVPTSNCSQRGFKNTYLCGYELVTNLSFDRDGDGSTWTLSDDGLTVILDSDDDLGDISSNINTSTWEPIGTMLNPFTAIFEGNNNSIAWLVILETTVEENIGLFSRVSDSFQARNVHLTDLLIHTEVQNNGFALGGFVGSLGGNAVVLGVSITRGRIIHGINTSGMRIIGGLVGDISSSSVRVLASSVINVHFQGGQGQEIIGGLVGSLGDALIASSYVSNLSIASNGNVNKLGGLVGTVSTGTIFASYARSVNINTGSNVNVEAFAGGLVGEFTDSGNIIASYSLDVMLMEQGGNNNFLGGLVGSVSSNPRIAMSYSSGISFVGGKIGILVGNLEGTINSTFPSYGFNTNTDSMNSMTAFPDSVPDSVTGRNPDITNINNLTSNTSSTTLSERWSESIWDFGTTTESPALRYADYTGIIDCSAYKLLLSDKKILCGVSLLAGQR